jgi:predicted dehydrogenase
LPTRVKVIGAGSIGNHLSQAARRMGWEVDLCDVDPAALERTRTQIYPTRYGSWDPAIRLFQSKDVPKGGYDYIFIGTPPDSHMSLGLAAAEENPRAVLIEKPLCQPDLASAQQLHERLTRGKIRGFVGYDHVVAASVAKVDELLRAGVVGKVLAIDVEFREHWGGILKAHPWLSGPEDSYLAYWRRGGGACGEHSHALNLWQHFAHVLGQGRIEQVAATADYVSLRGAQYDRACYMNVRTEGGLLGRIAQDVVTAPPRKWARIEGDAGAIEWHCNYAPGEDAVFLPRAAAGQQAEFRFKKTRPDDFLQELRHIEAALEKGTDSPISMIRGLDSMLVIAAAHASAQAGRAMRIQYDKGYRPDAVQPSMQTAAAGSA